MPADDVNRVDVLQQQWIGFRRLDPQGVRVRGAHRLDRAQRTGIRRHAAGNVTRPLQGIHQVIGGQRLAILPFDVLTQVELPRGGIYGFPAFGQPRQGLVIATFQQRLKHMQRQ